MAPPLPNTPFPRHPIHASQTRDLSFPTPHPCFLIPIGLQSPRRSPCKSGGDPLKALGGGRGGRLPGAWSLQVTGGLLTPPPLRSWCTRSLALNGNNYMDRREQLCTLQARKLFRSRVQEGSVTEGLYSLALCLSLSFSLSLSVPLSFPLPPSPPTLLFNPSLSLLSLKLKYPEQM